MKERPILFNGPMVRAILDDRKTMTRRLDGLKTINSCPSQWVQAVRLNDGTWIFWGPFYVDEEWVRNKAYPNGGGFKPPYSIGDHLYVRETWMGAVDGDEPLYGILYKASWNQPKRLEPDFRLDERAKKYFTGASRWRPSIHMPKWAARLWLDVTDVRAERIQDISRKDAKSEGFWPSEYNGLESWAGKLYGNTQLAFEACWKDLYPGSWERNDWVFAYTFKVLR